MLSRRDPRHNGEAAEGDVWARGAPEIRAADAVNGEYGGPRVKCPCKRLLVHKLRGEVGMVVRVVEAEVRPQETHC